MSFDCKTERQEAFKRTAKSLELERRKGTTPEEAKAQVERELAQRFGERGPCPVPDCPSLTCRGKTLCRSDYRWANKLGILDGDPLDLPAAIRVGKARDQKNANLRAHYKISLEDYEALLYVSQNGICLSVLRRLQRWKRCSQDGSGR